jgi:hypothetical protein
MPNAFSVFDGGGTAEYLAEPAPDGRGGYMKGQCSIHR